MSGWEREIEKEGREGGEATVPPVPALAAGGRWWGPRPGRPGLRRPGLGRLRRRQRVAVQTGRGPNSVASPAYQPVAG